MKLPKGQRETALADIRMRFITAYTQELLISQKAEGQAKTAIQKAKLSANVSNKFIEDVIGNTEGTD
jgi:hypothetical protein